MKDDFERTTSPSLFVMGTRRLDLVVTEDNGVTECFSADGFDIRGVNNVSEP
jgi:hypothetical protein